MESIYKMTTHPSFLPLSAFRFPLFALVPVLLVCLLTGCEVPVTEEPAVEVSRVIARPLPKLEVEGWLNGGPVVPEELKGTVIVVDCWASWCQPCAQAAPALVATYIKYRTQGVQFMGLTSETGKDLTAIQGFIDRYSTLWPIAYGAEKPLIDLQVDAIPRMFVVGRDGLIKWDSMGPGTLERALRDALSESGERKAESGNTGSNY